MAQFLGLHLSWINDDPGRGMDEESAMLIRLDKIIAVEPNYEEGGTTVWLDTNREDEMVFQVAESVQDIQRMITEASRR